MQATTAFRSGMVPCGLTYTEQEVERAIQPFLKT